MNIATRLDSAMRSAKVGSQSQLARMSGVPQPTISRILKGQGTQGAETVTLVALANALNVDLRWLQQGIGSPTPARIQKTDKGEKAPEPVLAVVEPPKADILQWVTAREAELLTEYRARAEPQRARILVVARSLPKAEGGVGVSDKV
jgi:transcriptional regulator with XRE-family HTH domain